MNATPPISSPASQKGVVLLESLIAILIFSFGILGIVGLQAAMVKNTSDAKYRAEASFIAQQRLGVMWTDQANLGNYAVGQEDISTLLPNGTRLVEFPAADRVRITITWQQPGQDMHNLVINTSITGGT